MHRLKRVFLLIVPGATEHLHNCLKTESNPRPASNKFDLGDENINRGYRLVDGPAASLIKSFVDCLSCSYLIHSRYHLYTY